MPEKTNDKTIFSLLEVTQSIQKTLSERYTSSFWVKAEMNKLNFYRQSGHCYPELVEKQDGKVIAQIKSHLWRDDYIRANNNFKTVLKEPLKDGIKILFLATVSFDPVHGLALWILDIDPSYTLGDLEREKQETIRRLNVEGIFSNNKTLELPLLPQRIAIISVETSKGYADFLKVIETNSWNYKFFHLLFPSLLQGDKAVNAICDQLKRIERIKSHFDVVAIIRGGGGDVGLSCYNSYQLAKEIALFPIPVITGIGHATNETVTEMVSFSNAITPTKLAEFLLQKFHNFSVLVRRAEETIIDKSYRLMEEAKNKLQSEVKLFRSVAENILITNRNEVREVLRSLFHQSQFALKNEKESLIAFKTEMRRGTIAFCNSTRQTIRQFAITIRKDASSQISQFQLILLQSKERLSAHASLHVKHTRIELNNIDKNIVNMSPHLVLKRGYSITRCNGKAVKNTHEVTSGDTLITTVFEGNINSVVQSTNKTAKE
jgi:exodeoxyribonuclease VII large subunit